MHVWASTWILRPLDGANVNLRIESMDTPENERRTVIEDPGRTEPCHARASVEGMKVGIKDNKMWLDDFRALIISVISMEY